MVGNKNIKGVTLIELMIAVAIMGILASIAYPSYTSYVAKSNRTEAMRELVRLANLQEQYYMDTRTYTADLKKLGLPNAIFTTESGYYKISTVLTDGTSGFVLTATAQGGQSTTDASCKTLTIDHLGSRGGLSADCWED